MNHNECSPEKISRSAIIELQGNIETVFPLFGAFEERQWSKGWNPQIIYPSEEIMEEGTVFKTKGHDGRSEFIWTVAKFQRLERLVQYFVYTLDRQWTITVKCTAKSDQYTSAEITYSFLGLNCHGNEINKAALNNMSAHQLKDWENQLNDYLNSK